MGIDPAKVTACLVTRGDVDLTPILDSLIFDDIVVWDNSKRTDAAAYGRFLAMRDARNEVCFTQDDDAIIPPETQRALCDTYVDGLLNANMEADRHGQSWAWFGWGALVQRELCEMVWKHYGLHERGLYPRAFFKTGCDILAGTLIPRRLTAYPFQHLDYAFGADRLCQTVEYPAWKQDMIAEAQALPPMPLKLNLGCGDHRLPGFVNLDLQTGFRFEAGIPYEDGRVDAISASHTLMFVALEDWPYVFSEFARVLKPGGTLRITEDATDDPRSERHGGHPDAVTLTSLQLVFDHLSRVGMSAREVKASEGREVALCQDYHGGYPKCFFIEGIANG